MIATTESICPQHRARSTDFVAYNSKQEPVFRCQGEHKDAGTGIRPIYMPHYYTVSADAKARLAKAGTK